MTQNRQRALKKPDVDWILLAMTLFEATAFILLAFCDGFDPVPLILAVSVPLILIAQVLLLGRAFPHMDKYILIVANFLCGVGLIMLYRLSPDKALKQLLFYGLGVMIMVCMTFLVARFRFWRMLRLPTTTPSAYGAAATIRTTGSTMPATSWGWWSGRISCSPAPCTS